MSQVLDCYWSFRSPYSYLAVRRLRDWRRDYELDINIKLVYPIAVRIQGFFKNQPPQWLPYLLTDCAREAERLAIPLGMPRPDPIVMDMNTGEVAKEQVIIQRLNLLGMAATEVGLALEFIDEVSTLIWSGEVDGWNEGDHLAEACERAGLSLASLEKSVEENGERFQAVIEKNQEQQSAAGHWGVPLFSYRNEPFFGQYRMDTLLWRMQQNGLSRRDKS